MLLLATASCESTDDPKHPVVEGDVLVEDVNNYQAVLKLNLPRLTFDPATEVVVDWAATRAGNNIRNQPVQSIDMVVVAQFPGTEMGTQTAIEKGYVGSKVIQAQQYTVPAGGTQAALSELVPTKATYFASTTVTYLITVSTGTQAGDGIQAVALLIPTAGDPATTLTMPVGYDELQSFTPTLGATLDVPAIDPGSIGWGDVTKDGLGQLVQDWTRVNRVLVAYFEGMQPEQLANQDTFLQLENQATTLYQATIAHPGSTPTTAVQLSNLVNALDNSAFTGFTQHSGTWIFAAMCDVCNNPAMVLSVLNPVGE